MDGDVIEIPVQAAVPAALEQWDMGVPAARLDASNKAWAFSGGWTTSPAWDGIGVAERKTSTAKGNVATFTFEGTAVALVGRMAQDGGRADVFLDGNPAGTIDAYIPPRTFDNDLWHRDGLSVGSATPSGSSPGRTQARSRPGPGSPSRSGSCIARDEDRRCGVGSDCRGRSLAKAQAPDSRHRQFEYRSDHQRSAFSAAGRDDTRRCVYQGGGGQGCKPGGCRRARRRCGHVRGPGRSRRRGRSSGEWFYRGGHRRAACVPRSGDSIRGGIHLRHAERGELHHGRVGRERHDQPGRRAPGERPFAPRASRCCNSKFRSLRSKPRSSWRPSPACGWC